MTQQQPSVVLRASDIANAIMNNVIEAQTTYMYLASVLKENGGSLEVTSGTLEALKNTEHWEVTLENAGEGRVRFRLLEGAAQINAAMGRTPAGLIVPD